MGISDIASDRIYALGGSLDRTTGRLYQQITALLAEQVRSGGLGPGEAIPSQRQLSEAWGVSEVTVRRAMQALAEQGLIEARAGGGTVVLPGRHGSPSTPASDRVLTVGVAFADLVDGYPFFQPVLAGLRDAPRPIAVRLFDLPADEQAAGGLAHAPPLDDLDALVMMSPVNLRLLATCQARKLPTVLLFNDVADGYSRCILPAYGRGVAQAVQHLHSRGRRRIALVTAAAERFSTARWVEAFDAAKASLGLDDAPELVIHADYGESQGHAAALSLLHAADRPGAILFASDFMARGGLLAAHELGLRVPDDVAIVGAGRVLDDTGWPVPLTTIDLQLEAIGRLAREAIEHAVTRASPPASLHQAVPTELRIGATS